MSTAGPSEVARRGLAGRVLGGRYRVVRMVSAGASTLIADADDTELGRPVTVKLVRPEIAESDPFRRRFAATMRAMAKLSHPNIAAVYDWGEEEVGRRTTVYAVVEHLAGGSLRDLFDRGRRLDPSQALMVGLEACRGLDFAHRKSLVHGEITPSKLVFGDDRRLRIVDFGLARLLGAADWQEPSTVPTHVARYCSPEQALGQPIDGKSDVYSLALVLVEAVSGSVPFAARSTVATLSARVGRLMPVSADLGPLAAVLERAGRPDPTDRSTASELGRALVRAAEKLPRPAPIPLVVTSRIDDDPSRLRRPNDPTGGVERPPPEPEPALVPPAERSATPEPVESAAAPPTEVAAVVTTVGAPETATEATAALEADMADATEATSALEADAADATEATEATEAAEVAAAPPALEEADELAEPTVPATPEEHAAAASMAEAAVAASVISRGEHGQPGLPPPPPPVTTALASAGAGGASPALYDGDDDLVRDELAALAQPPSAVPAPTAPDPPVPTDVIAVTTAPPLPAAPAPRRRRRWLPWVLALVVLGALVGLGFVAYLLFKVPTHPVPELVGLDEAAARAQTADFNWDLEIEHARSDDHPDPGEIIRTSPSAGEELAEDEPFLIVVSDGPEFRSLPDVAGLPLAEADTELAELQLTSLTPIEQPDENVAAGSVISWSVPADPSLGVGGQVLPGAEVQLVVSTGPAPRTVPTVVGLTVEQATAALQAIQLGVTVAEPVFSDDIATGSVVSSDPPEGTGGISRGSTITITPSKGVDLVTMPDLTGQTLAQAQSTLAAAGLQVGALLGNSQGLFAQATVQGQPAAAGSQFKRGSAVDLVFL